jgi:hypothetical protein
MEPPQPSSFACSVSVVDVFLRTSLFLADVPWRLNGVQQRIIRRTGEEKGQPLRRKQHALPLSAKSHTHNPATTRQGGSLLLTTPQYCSPSSPWIRRWDDVSIAWAGAKFRLWDSRVNFSLSNYYVCAQEAAFSFSPSSHEKKTPGGYAYDVVKERERAACSCVGVMIRMEGWRKCTFRMGDAAFYRDQIVGE